jgi:hypothetical protein
MDPSKKARLSNQQILKLTVSVLSAGERITRELAETLAEHRNGGSQVLTKTLDLLVLADPNTQSGKAKKARSYGTRILAETVFWKMVGISVDEQEKVG